MTRNTIRLHALLLALTALVAGLDAPVTAQVSRGKELSPAAAEGRATLTQAQTLEQRSSLRGAPLVRRFDPDDYGVPPLHFDVLPLDDGEVLVGNQDGMLHFDGLRWRLVELPGRSPLRVLVPAEDGSTMLGGFDFIGKLDRAADGSLLVIDLTQAVIKALKGAPVGVVWQFFAYEGATYARTDTHLIKFVGDQPVQTWSLDGSQRSLFGTSLGMVGRQQGVGLVQLTEAGFEPFPGGSVFADQRLASILDDPSGPLLIGDQGFYRLRTEGPVAIPGPGSDLLSRYQPYVAIRVGGGGVLVGTTRGRILQFDADLMPQGAVELSSYSLLGLRPDQEGGVWVATEGELLRAKLPSAWSVYGPEQGLAGTPADAQFFDGALYIASSVGVFRSQRSSSGGSLAFSLAVPTRLEAFDLEVTPAGLLIAEREHLLLLRASTDEPDVVPGIDAAYFIEASRYTPGQYYVIAEDALVLFELNDGQFAAKARWPLGTINLSGLEEYGPGSVFIGDSRGGAVRIRFDPASGVERDRMEFGKADGLTVDPARGTSLYRDGDAIIAVSGKLAFRYEAGHFVPETGGLIALSERPMELSVVATPIGDFAVTSRELFRRSGENQQWQRVQLNDPAARGFSWVAWNSDGALRIMTWTRVLQFDPAAPADPAATLTTRLARITAKPADGTEQRFELLADDLGEISGHGTLAIEVSPPGFEPGGQYRYSIDGITDDFTPWQSMGNGVMTLRDVDPGEYRLTVQTRTAAGIEAEPRSLDFWVAAPWWRQPSIAAAGVLALFIAAGLLAQAIVSARSRRFEQSRVELEARISERTAELEQANAQLAELATEDSLTGLSNRRAFDHGLAREWSRCQAQHAPIALLMIDVDYFKQFNDEHGHLAGDAALRSIAQLLARDVEPMRELLARFGGEEFALVLPAAELSEAAARAETLRARAQNADLRGLTLSIGVAVAKPAEGGEDVDLIQAADEALYQAKRDGRNRVAAAANPPPTA